MRNFLDWWVDTFYLPFADERLTHLHKLLIDPKEHWYLGEYLLYKEEKRDSSWKVWIANNDYGIWAEIGTNSLVNKSQRYIFRKHDISLLPIITDPQRYLLWRAAKRRMRELPITTKSEFLI